MVYVDSLAHHGWKMRGKRVKSCHLMAHSVKELLEFGASIGLKQEWAQNIGKPGKVPHFDLTERKRADAVRAGAETIPRAYLYGFTKRWRECTARGMDRLGPFTMEKPQYVLNRLT